MLRRLFLLFLLVTSTAVVSIPDRKLMARSRPYNTKQITQLTNFGGIKNSYVAAIDFSPDGKLIASGSHDKCIKVWDIEKRVEVASLKGHKKVVIDIAFSADNKLLASCCVDGKVIIWEAKSYEKRSSLKGADESAIAFHPNSKLIASGGEPDISDITRLIDYLYLSHSPLAPCP